MEAKKRSMQTPKSKGENEYSREETEYGDEWKTLVECANDTVQRNVTMILFPQACKKKKKDERRRSEESRQTEYRL